MQLTAAGDLLYAADHLLSPERALVHDLAAPAGLSPQAFRLAVLENGTELLAFSPPAPAAGEAPPPAAPAEPPTAIESTEELFLNGLHLEQYRHATAEPEAYYREALRRDPLDSRSHNAMGRLLLRRGKFAEAAEHLHRAVASVTRRNPNPYDGEPYYNLGLALCRLASHSAAYDAFYKATWNAAWQDAAYFELARLACHAGRYAEALAHLSETLARNGRHHGGHHLRAAILRRMEQLPAAADAVDSGLAQDPMNYGLHVERYLLNGNELFRTLFQNNANTYLEVALDYAQAGLWVEAEQLLLAAPPADPMLCYVLGWVQLQAGDEAGAEHSFAHAAALPPDYCFPNSYHCVPVLESAMRCNPHDARAPYYLGNFWYAHRRHAEAIACWEQAGRLDPAFPTVQRNLGIAYANEQGDLAQAQAHYATALALDPGDARIFFEADQLDKKCRVAPDARLAKLEAHDHLVQERDDLTVEYVTLLNLAGRHAEALERLTTRTFHPWEGGEGKVAGQYVNALVELAKAQLAAGNSAAAIDFLERARHFPDNLGEGKLAGARENQIDYYLGCACAAGDQSEPAARHFQAATTGSAEPAAALYYNDQPPDLILYQALAHRALGDLARCSSIAQGLVDYGEAQRDTTVTIDYFAVSLPDFLVFEDDMQARHRRHCRYMIGLGYLGLEQPEQAAACFDAVLADDPAHLGASLHSRLLRGG